MTRLLGRVDVGAASICYETHGQGPPLLLLSGLGAGRWVWAPQVEGLKDRFQLITVDNRGTGESSRIGGWFSVADMARDALAVLDAVGVGQAHVAGMSMGGFIAQTIAAQWPERVNRLVLACTSWRGFGRVWPRPEVFGFLARGKALRVFLSEEYLATHRDELEAWFDARRGLRAPSAVVAAQLRACLAFNLGRLVGRIQAPTLVVHGTADRVIPVSNGRSLGARIPGARLLLYEGASHGFTVERAADFNRDVAAFLGDRT